MNECVYCAVRTEYLNIILVNVRLKRVNRLLETNKNHVVHMGEVKCGKTFDHKNFISSFHSDDYEY